MTDSGEIMISFSTGADPYLNPSNFRACVQLKTVNDEHTLCDSGFEVGDFNQYPSGTDGRLLIGKGINGNIWKIFIENYFKQYYDFL